MRVFAFIEAEKADLDLTVTTVRNWMRQARIDAGEAEGLTTDEPQARSSTFADQNVKDTEWGSGEFGRYDPDGNALVFYRDR